MALSFLAACAGFLALACLYHWPRSGVLVYYIVMRPAFLWAAMLVPFLLAGLVGVRPRWFALGAAVCVVCFVTVEDVPQALKRFPAGAREDFSAAQMAFRSYIAQGGASRGDISVPLRVVSWNVLTGTMGAREAVGQLAGLNPDIVLFQEFGPGDRMQKAIKQCAQFNGYSCEGSRTGILSRFPIEALPRGAAGPRLSSAWKVRIMPGFDLVCVNVHLSPPVIKTQLVRGWSRGEVADAVSRKTQEFNQVSETLGLYARQSAVMLAGDFNVPPHYPGLKAAAAGLKDCFAANGYGWGKTAPLKLPAVRVDMVFVPGSSEVYYAAAIPTLYSDHYMTLAEVSVPLRRTPPTETAQTSEAGSDSQWLTPLREGSALPLEKGGRPQVVLPHRRADPYLPKVKPEKAREVRPKAGE